MPVRIFEVLLSPRAALRCSRRLAYWRRLQTGWPPVKVDCPLQNVNLSASFAPEQQLLIVNEPTCMNVSRHRQGSFAARSGRCLGRRRLCAGAPREAYRSLIPLGQLANREHWLNSINQLSAGRRRSRVQAVLTQRRPLRGIHLSPSATVFSRNTEAATDEAKCRQGGRR